MPMQPKPSADTSKPLIPSLRFCILNRSTKANGETILHRNGRIVLPWIMPSVDVKNHPTSRNAEEEMPKVDSQAVRERG